MALYIWRYRKISVVYANGIEEARKLLLGYRNHFSEDEIEYIDKETPEIIDTPHVEVFPDCESFPKLQIPKDLKACDALPCAECTYTDIGSCPRYRWTQECGAKWMSPEKIKANNRSRRV